MAEAPIVRVDARAAALEPDPLDADQVVAGDPRTSAFVLAPTAHGEESGVCVLAAGTETVWMVHETLLKG